MWMQNQALMTKQKLWGRSNQPLSAGKYSLLIENRYKISNMRITKGLKISESSKLGGKSYFIPIVFAFGSIGCIIYAIVFYKKFSPLDQKIRDDWEIWIIRGNTKKDKV